MKLTKFIGKTIRKNIAPWLNMDSLISHQEEKSKYPNIYILGLPRSGTTLLYQTVANHFHVSYFPNFSNVFYKSAFTIDKLFGNKIINQNNLSYESNFGTTKGLFAPSEAGGVFNYYFKNNQNILDFYHLLNIQKNRHKVPFLFKNLNFIHHLDTLKKHDENVIILYIERDPVQVTQSIFKKNKKGKGIGFEGLGKEDYSENNITSLARLIYDFNKDFKNQIQSFPNHLIISYEELCENPNIVIDYLTDHDLLTLKDQINSKDLKFDALFKQSLPEKEWNELNNFFHEKNNTLEANENTH